MSKSRVALDSCSIMHLLTEHVDRSPHLLPIYKDAVAGKHVIVLSEISVSECARLRSIGATAVTPADSVRKLNEFFSRPFIIRRGVTSRESEFAATLIRDFGLGACDALIAATCAYADVGVLYSTDGCSHRRKDGKLLTVGTVVTPCGKRMEVRCPNPTHPVGCPAHTPQPSGPELPPARALDVA